MPLSVVIPALDEAARLPATLEAVRRGVPAAEIVVADGGSRDTTRAIAMAAGARLVDAPEGRGRQLAAGAAAARGPWLLFLHADSAPGPGAAEAAQDFMAGPDAASRAAFFRFALDDPAPAARRLERMVAWRCRWLALPYGDQGLLIHRRLHDHVGGFRPLPLMEDVDLVRRLGRHRLVGLDAPLVTSAERFRRDGYLARSARNLLCLALWRAGVPPRRLVRLYQGLPRRSRVAP